MTFIPRLVAAMLTACCWAAFAQHQPSISEADVFPPPAYGADPGREHGRSHVPHAVYGTVTRVDSARASGKDSNPGAGAVIGGAIGAVIGRQVGGSGDARAAGTLVGAVIGAIAGHHIEKRRRGGDPVSRVTVQLDSGQMVAIDETQGQDLRVGDRVRIENNQISRLPTHPGRMAGMAGLQSGPF